MRDDQLHQQDDKEKEREVYGSKTSIEDEDYVLATECNDHKIIEQQLFVTEARNKLKEHLVVIFDDLMEGYKVSHISKKRSIDTRKVNKYIEDIRRILKPFKQEAESFLC